MTLDPVRASMLGKIGMHRRWAKTVVPDERRAATQKARDAQRTKYLAKAREMVDGDTLTEQQLGERADQLRKADLARMRLRRWEGRDVSQIEKRQLFDGARSVPCVDCGGSFPLVAMDLDHVRGPKIASVSQMPQGPFTVDQVVAEIAKCEPVCSNCHRVRTSARFRD